MKPLLSFSLALLAAVAVGQTKQDDAVIAQKELACLQYSEHDLRTQCVLAAEHPNDKIVLGIPATASDITIGKQFCDYKIKLDGASKKVREIFPSECHPAASPICTGACMTGVAREPKDSAPDVPAIEKTAPGTDPLLLRDPLNCVDGWTSNVLYGNKCLSRKYVSCEDEARILLIAEDGTHWCHKPQP